MELATQLFASGAAAACADGGVSVLHALAMLGATATGESVGKVLELAKMAVASSAPNDGRDDDGCSPGLVWLLCGPLGQPADDWFNAIGLGAEGRSRAETQVEQRGDCYAWRLLLLPETSDDEKMRLLRSVTPEAKLGFHGNTWLMRICMLPVDQAVKLGGMLLDAHPTLDASAVNANKVKKREKNRKKFKQILFSGVLFIFLHLVEMTLFFQLQGGCSKTTRQMQTQKMDTEDQGERKIKKKKKIEFFIFLYSLHLCGSVGMARLLLVHGGKLDLQDSNNNNVLHTALLFGSPSLLDLLLASLKRDDHPLLYAKNSDGLTPFQMLFAAKDKLICVPFYHSDPFSHKQCGVYFELQKE